MCLNCQTSGLADTAENRAKLQGKIRSWSREMDEMIDIKATKVEDVCREAAVCYHSSRIVARKSGVVHPKSLEMCKEYFELSSPSEYDAIFKPFHDTIAALVDLRSRYIRYTGTAEALNHRIEVEIIPRLGEFKKLVSEAKYIPHTMEHRFGWAKDLGNLTFCIDGMSDNRRNPWFHPINTNDDEPLRPTEMGEEWELFRKWVSCLPETPHAIAAGQTLDEVACLLLYGISDDKADEDNNHENDLGLREWDEDRGVWVVFPAQVE